MHCPKCKVKLMVDVRKKPGLMNVRCIKCGSEFIIKQGRIAQKKIKKVKKTFKKGVTITPGALLKGTADQKQLKMLKHHERMHRQLEQIRKLNKQVDQINKLRKRPL
ncbi:MAG: hypothetical protein KKH94_06605 [Candidatus Omnitrophica bacterium]|nr:hypothetical protein [Candidatus Omnitrophota bacterium]